MSDEETSEVIQIHEKDILSMSNVQILNFMNDGRITLSSYYSLNNEIIRRLLNATDV